MHENSNMRNKQMEIHTYKILPFFKIPRTHAWKITPFLFRDFAPPIEIHISKAYKHFPEKYLLGRQSKISLH